LGGAIDITSTPGYGTRVEVFLPIAGERKREKARHEHASGSSGGRDFDSQVLKLKLKENKGGSPC
jgi:hypothetical protein